MSDQAYAHQTLIVKRSSKYGIPKKSFHCFVECLAKKLRFIDSNSIYTFRPVFNL
jgi:hypothetical protein